MPALSTTSANALDSIGPASTATDVSTLGFFFKINSLYLCAFQRINKNKCKINFVVRNSGVYLHYQ
jgi:hypothetical protein